MKSLPGFRPPQFSEDETWLPSWLQPHEFNQGISPPESSSMDSPFPLQNTWTGEDANGVYGEEGRYKSCHLFLSGEDNSPRSFSPSCNALHFCLHLSSDNYSENAQSLFTEMSLPEISQSNHAMQINHIGTSAVSKEKANQHKCKVSQDAGLVKVAPSPPQEKPEKMGHQNLCGGLDTGTKCEDIVWLLKVTDITDAIELSVAASEALLIHEVLESESSTKSLYASAILEVALRVKQSRLEGCKEHSNLSHDESSDSDSLSDLDESAMADAYEEVGILVSPVVQHDCDSISQVNDTYAMENHESGKKCIYEDHGRLRVDSADVHTKQKLKDVNTCCIQSNCLDDLALESLGSDEIKKPIDGVAQELKTSKGVGVDYVLNCSVQVSTEILSTKKISHISSDEIVNSTPQARISENAERYDRMYTTPNKFQTRWLGGWTGKSEGNASAGMEYNGARHIPEYFVGETSLISESADIAPDENSFVQNQDKGSTIVSQSSVHLKDVRTKNTDEIYLFEEATNSSSPSTADPLCSVVPCSITSENAFSTLGHNQNDKADTGKCFVSISEHLENNFQRFSSPDKDLVNAQGLTVQETSVESSQTITRRKVTSLRTYSMLLPSHGAKLGKGSGFCDQSLLLKCNTNVLDTNAESPTANSRDKLKNYDENTKNVPELPTPMQNGIGFPGTMHSFHASMSFLHDIGEEKPEKTAVLERDAKLLKVKNPQFENSHHVKATGIKRVRFAEAKICFPQKKKRMKVQNTNTNYCFTRTRSKSLNPYSEARAQELMWCPKKYLSNSSRRLIFLNMEFLLAGFSGEQEKEIEGLIKKFGGMVLSDIPSPPGLRARKSVRFRRRQIPVVLCLKKLHTLKFLYGCAVKACILTVDWLTDSISAGFVLSPEKYAVLANLCGEMCSRLGKPVLCDGYIFDNAGIMLHGTPSFCKNIAKLIKHGGGIVFKTLQRLVQFMEDGKISVGAIVAEDENGISRHLKQCASEWKIPLMPNSWISNSLYAGTLLPFKNNDLSSSHKLLDN